MLLIRLRDRLQHRLRDDDGAAMASVLALMLVGALISTLILSSVIGAFAQTTQTRANVQSQAAAQAGISVAVAGLQKATGDPQSCQAVGGVYESASAPRYRATVWYNGVRGCPTGAGAVKVISSGWASAPGIAGASSGDVAYLEATFAIGMSQASGAALYIYNSSNLNAFSVDVADPTSAGNVMVENGSIGCTSNSTIRGDIIVANGAVNITNTCHITGSIRATGNIKITSNVTVDGDVISSGGSIELTNDTIVVGGGIYANGFATVHGRVGQNIEATGVITMVNTASAAGSVWGGSSASISGSIGGDLTVVGALSIPQSGTTIKGSVTAGGRLNPVAANTKIDGSVSAAGTGETKFNNSANVKILGNFAVGGTLDGAKENNKPSSGASDSDKVAWYLKDRTIVIGTVRHSIAGLTVPVGPTPRPAPTVPGWVDWKYTESEGTAHGFTKLVWPTTHCSVGNWNKDEAAIATVLNQIKNSTVPLVVDATGCPSLSIQMGGTINVRSDIAIINKSFTGADLTWGSADGQPHKLYLLTSDGNTALAGPQCTGGAADSDPWGKWVVTGPLAAIVYTPCTFKLNAGTQWRGQLYAGNFAMSSSESLVFVPVGIPGTSLSAGGGSGPQVGVLSPMESLRNRSGNGE